MDYVTVDRSTEAHDEILAALRALLHVSEDARFPAPQPTALSRAAAENEIMSGRREYLVCEKTDGCRKLVFFTRLEDCPLVLAIDRRLEIERIFFPDDCVFAEALFDGTVLDCELAMRLSSNSAANVSVSARVEAFVAFDAYALGGAACSHKNLVQRLELARAIVAQCPRFFFELKPMYPFDQLQAFCEVPHLPKKNKKKFSKS